MTDQPRPLSAALEDWDVTLALTPAQLLLVVAGAWLLVKLLRRLRG